MDNKIKIEKKEDLKSCDYKTFSIRIKSDTIAELDKIAQKSNRSKNELIRIFIEFGMQNYDIVE